MRFDENLRQFVYEYEGIIFAWDEEPGEDFPDTVKKLAANYYERLDDIVRYIAPDLKEMYGITDPGEVESKLGKPVIDLTMGEINYLEHTFDYEHIFTLEYMDDEFKQLSHFSVDG